MNDTDPNDIKLFGIFNELTEGETLEVVDHYGFSINSPVHPAVIPRFKTMSELTARISQVITDFTNIQTNITAVYKSATNDAYGSFMFGIEVQKSFEYDVSFSSPLSLGDLSAISVQESFLILEGSYLFSNEFGVILGPDDTTGLKIVSQISETNCTSSDQSVDFDIILFYRENPPIAYNISITSCVEGAAARADTVRTRVSTVLGEEEVTVSLVGSSSLVLAFNPHWSKAQVYVPEENIYGLKNDTQKKSGFHFANGATSLQAELELSGGSNVISTILDVIEVTASIEPFVSGSLEFNSGTSGQLVSLDIWVSNIRSMLNASDGFHDPDFAISTISLDGNFGALVELREPFAAEEPFSIDGSFVTPFELDLLDIAAVGSRRPDIEFDIDVPNIGDIKNLSFGDVVKLLKQALEFLVGDPDNGDTVESCSGGLLGKEILGKNVFTYRIPVLGISACEFAGFLQIVVYAIDQLVNDCTECDDPDAQSSSFTALETKLNTLLQDAVGGTPSVEFTPTSDDTRSSLDVDLVLQWSFLEARQLNIDLAAILEGFELDEVLLYFAKGILPFDGSALTELSGTISFSLGVGLEFFKETETIIPYLRGITGVTLTFSADANGEFQASIGALSAAIGVAATIDNYGEPLSISVGLDPSVNYYISTDVSLSRNGFQRVSSIGSLENEIAVVITGQVVAEIYVEFFGGLGNAFMRIQISDINNVILQKPGAVTLYYEASIEKIPSLIDILLMDPESVINAVDSLFKSVNDLTLGRQGIVTTFPMPFIGTSISRALKAGRSDNFLEKARRSVRSTLEEILNTYENDGGDSTVADVIAHVMTGILGDELGILDGNVTVNYYEHFGTQSLISYDNYQDNLEIKSLMWMIPMKQNYTVSLPPLRFDLENPAFPLQISTSSEEQILLSLEWEFNFAFGFDEDDGFFLYTFPHADSTQEKSEFFVRADFNLPLSSIDAKLIYFLNLGFTDFNLGFGAGIFVNIDKAHGMRRVDSPKSVRYGRLTLDDVKSRVPNQKDLFVVCASAAAAVTADDFFTELDLPVPGFEDIKPWIPKMNVGGDSENHTMALQAIVKRELSTRRERDSTPSRRSLLQPMDLNRLEESIPSNAHRGLRMLCASEIVGLDIDCPVDTAAGEFACVKLSNIRLDLTKIQDMISPILRKLVNPSANNGLFDHIAVPLEKLESRIPGISDAIGKTVTFLDVAEALVGPSCGADTVRTILSIWRGMRNLAQLFEETNDDGLLLADSCIYKPNRNRQCEGGTVDFVNDDGSRRLLELAQELEEVFPTHDLSGQRVTAVHSHYRMLTAGCSSNFIAPTCAGSCDFCFDEATKAKCKARKLRCLGTSSLGIDFPFMSDPAGQLLGLFSGQDIEIVDFKPPPMVFVFKVEISILLFVPPAVYLVLGFSASATVEYALLLDSKGIREAVQEKNPKKAGNSFAVRDIIDGVDSQLIVMEAKVYAIVEVSAVFVKVGVSGGLTARAKIDIFDPYPDISGGLVRPYELLALGTSPFDWFEITLSITLDLSLYIQIGIFIKVAFVKVEFIIYEWRVTYSMNILGPLRNRPRQFKKLGGTSSSGTLLLQDTDLICESKGGTVGDEELQCWEGDASISNPKIMSFKNVKKLDGGGLNRRRRLSDANQENTPSKHRNLQTSTFEFNCILSEADMTGTQDILISYERCKITSDTFEIGLTQAIGLGVFTYDSSLQTATVILPSPIQDTLTTVVRDCNAEWTLVGYSNILVYGDEVQSGCKIIADGTNEGDVILTVDFSQGPCTSGYAVSLNEGNIIISGNEIVSFGTPFKDIMFIMSNCNDEVIIAKTFTDVTSVEVLGNGGDDNIVIGDADQALDINVHGNIIIDSGAGSGDVLSILDQSSLVSKTIEVRPSKLSGIHGSKNETISYFATENINISLGNIDTRVRVRATVKDASLSIDTQDGNDTILVENVQGPLTIASGGGTDNITIKYTSHLGYVLIDAGADDDLIYIYDLFGRNGTVLGGAGNDLLLLDARGIHDNIFNTMHGSNLNWNGGEGNDTVEMYFVSNGTTNLNIVGDNMGINRVIARCIDLVCNMLSRETFLANVHSHPASEYWKTTTSPSNSPSSSPTASPSMSPSDSPSSSSSPSGISASSSTSPSTSPSTRPSTSPSTSPTTTPCIQPSSSESTIERINLDPTASIYDLQLSLNRGNNSMYFEDTFCIMDVFGGDDVDSFYIGQMYNDYRTVASCVSATDPVTTTLTARGHVSNGCSHPITLYGGQGNDFFDVLRNKCNMELDGESGNDVFIVRSFIDGSLEDQTLGYAKIRGGEDIDDFYIACHDDTTEDVPSYIVNDFVDIDGGTGWNNLTIYGTEQNDRFIVENGLVSSGSLSVKYNNIAYLAVAGEAGDDEITVLSTEPSMFLSIYGGQGSDDFIITPNSVSPVVSKNRRGHRGIIQHKVVSADDEGYNDLVVRGVEANVMDNDGDYGWVYTVDQESSHLITEDEDGHFSFYLYPTTAPEDDLFVHIVAPSDRDEQGNSYILVNGVETAILSWAAGEMDPKEVQVTYNTDSMKLDTTEMNLLLESRVDLDVGRTKDHRFSDSGKTKDQRFVNTDQYMLPVNIVLLPSINNIAGAKSVFVKESSNGVNVAEGSFGFDSTYNVYLRPCSGEMLDAISVQMTSSVPDQIELDPPGLTGTHFNNAECKATVTVAAIDDDIVEAEHYTTIFHTIRNSTDGNAIMLSDGTPLFATNVLVTIYDDDMPGVIIEETNGVTATAELDSNAKSAVGEPTYYEDDYTIRLTKEPAGNVEISVESLQVASDVGSSETRKQVLVNGDNSQTIIFTPTNWYERVTIQVTAIDDDIVEGVDWLNFAPRPSNLGKIQGPLFVSGGYSPYIPQLTSPLMLEHELNPSEFIIPSGSEFDLTSELVFEENQVDSIIFNHQDANEAGADAIIIPSHLLGVGIMQDLNFLGDGPFDGVNHEGIEVLIYNFGDENNILRINQTTEAVHIVNLDSTDGISDDFVDVIDLSGPMLINGGRGSDTVNVSSAERKLDKIRALLMFDGGDDEDTDVFFIDNSGDFDQNDIIIVTGGMVEMESMATPEGISDNDVNPILPRESYLVVLRNATGGSFSFTLNDPLTHRTSITTATIPFPPTIDQIEYAIDMALLPDQKSCGQLENSTCTSAVRAWQLGNSDTYIIIFAGERLNAGVSLVLNSADLENYYEEIFLNATNDAIMRTSGIAYTNIDDLVVNIGFQGNVVGNIRGTSANHTYIEHDWENEKDDKFFISSDANENHDTALDVDVLYGLLDYIRGDLHIELNTGRHRLFVSDCFSLIPKGVGSNGFLEITNSSITNLGDEFGDIFFSTSGGHWLDDFTLWFGTGDDQILVSSIPTHEINTTRITTAVHAGKGDDTLHVVLDLEEHKGALFVANGQEGDDLIDAGNSTFRHMILLGDGGDDTLYGGLNENVLIGDYGKIQWVDESGIIVARQGGGGYGDFTDNTVRNLHLVQSLYPPLNTNGMSTNSFDSGSDIIHGNKNRDIIFGSGGALDELHGYNSSDIIIGDFAIILIDPTVDYLYGIVSIDSHNCTEGGGRNVLKGGDDHDIIVGGGHSIDMIDAGSGSDFASGDCVWILFDNSDFHLRNVSSTSINVGGMDELRMGDGDDVAIGGQNIDTIYGGNGFNIMAGDNSEIVFFSTHLDTEGTPSDNTFSQTFSFWNRPKWVRSNCDKGIDIIYGGMGDGNYIIANDIQGTTLRTEIDFVYDDHGLVLFEENPVYQFSSADACTRFFVPDFSDSVNLCLDNGEVSNNADSGVYEHHSKKECCETHFWWRITQCMGNNHIMYISDSVKCDIKYEFDNWESKFTPGGWRASGLYDSLEECCGANFWWDIDNCMAISPNDARFSCEFKLSDLKAPISCQEADEIAAGWEYVVDNLLGDQAYSNITTIGCASLGKNADTGMTECGGCLAGLDYVGTTDAIFTEGVTQPESPWNEDDPEGIYHHAHKVLTLVTMDIRIFSYDCKDAACFQNLIFETIEIVRNFVMSGLFTLAVYEWSRFRGPPIEQLWLAEVDRSSWAQTSSFNPFITSKASSVGLEATSSGRCQVHSVNRANGLSAESVISNLQNITKTTLYSLTDDTRFVSPGMVVEQSLAVEITKICDQLVDDIDELVQCSDDPSTFDFDITIYLPYYAQTSELSVIMEDKLNSIASNGEIGYPISSCSLSEVEVFSFASYYPDWFKRGSCINDGLQPQYMSDRPDGYLFDKVEDCCKAHFSWDKSCGYNNPSGIWFYPQYDESTCYERPLSEFDSYDSEKYATKNICCIEKFSGDVTKCCRDGEGDCVSAGSPMYIPNWSVQTCQPRDSFLIPDWESNWAFDTLEECCEEYFKNNRKCNSAQQQVFAPHDSLMECESKVLSELEAWENEIYDTLHACCRDKFPNYITSCCEANGAGGCTLAGTVHWLPDWANGHCYEKDTNLVEDWEWRWAHDTLDSCCGRYFSSSGGCDRRGLMLLKFYAVDDHCGTKARSEFRAMEERFDSLDDCCRVKFPQSVSDCCETGDGDCSLSGSMKYIPKWQDQICYTKDENLLAGWERAFSKSTLRECCEHNMHYDVASCCENSDGDCLLSSIGGSVDLY